MNGVIITVCRVARKKSTQRDIIVVRRNHCRVGECGNRGGNRANRRHKPGNAVVSGNGAHAEQYCDLNRKIITVLSLAFDATSRENYTEVTRSPVTEFYDIIPYYTADIHGYPRYLGGRPRAVVGDD